MYVRLYVFFLIF